MEIKLIGFMGPRYAGKDTAGLYLLSKGYQSLEVEAFATPIKDILAKLYDLPRGLLEGLTPEARVWRETPHSNLGGKTPVEAMQYLGEGLRAFYPETWVNYLERSLTPRLPATSFYIKDVRHLNEVKLIQRLGGLVIYIDNPNRKLDRFSQDTSEQAELYRDAADYEVSNASTIENFYKELDKLFEQLNN